MTLLTVTEDWMVYSLRDPEMTILLTLEREKKCPISLSAGSQSVRPVIP